MNNNQIWETFISHNSAWENTLETGEKIQLTYFQLKKIVETAAKYARQDGFEEGKRVAGELHKKNNSNNRGKTNFDGNIFNDIFGGLKNK
jgi:hypothetical protein